MELSECDDSTYVTRHPERDLARMHVVDRDPYTGGTVRDLEFDRRDDDFDEPQIEAAEIRLPDGSMRPPVLRPTPQRHRRTRPQPTFRPGVALDIQLRDAYLVMPPSSLSERERNDLHRLLAEHPIQAFPTSELRQRELDYLSYMRDTTEGFRGLTLRQVRERIVSRALSDRRNREAEATARDAARREANQPIDNAFRINAPTGQWVQPPAVEFMPVSDRLEWNERGRPTPTYIPSNLDPVPPATWSWDNIANNFLTLDEAPDLQSGFARWSQSMDELGNAAQRLNAALASGAPPAEDSPEVSEAENQLRPDDTR